MDIATYIQALKDEQTATALQSLQKPQNRDGFGYGHACGMIQGFDRALYLLNEMMDKTPGRKPLPRVRNPYTEELDAAPVLPEQQSGPRNSYTR